MKDRDQKAKAIRYAVARGWLPQLEVDVHFQKSVATKPSYLTDLDVLVSIPDDFSGFKSVVFDCKTKAKESPINRALWLRGVLDKIDGQQGFCILKKPNIDSDHRMVATNFGIIMLAEDEFDTYANSMSHGYNTCTANICNIDLWDQLFAIGGNYPNLIKSVAFRKSNYWMIDDAAEACRKTIASLQDCRAELDPEKPEHVAIVADYSVILSRSLSILVTHLFKSYLQPKQQIELENALKVMLYGGREAYEHRNQLYKLVKEQRGDGDSISELTLPEWPKFVQLIRQLLDSPLSVSRVPLIIREAEFTLLAGSTNFNYVKQLCEQDKQAGRFAILILSYLIKAGRLPKEFSERIENPLITLLT
jgi:hypothetical protein